MKITDDQILSICVQQIEAGSNGGSTGELADQRAEALDRYLGEPDGNEIDGRSQVRTREVLETVEGILPSLVRIFTESDNMVTFTPRNADDESQSEQESDAVNYVYWNQNKGFYNTYTFLKDCLLSKVGVMKVWADVSDREEREEYEALDEMQLGELLNEDGIDREVLEYDVTEKGYNVIFMAKEKRTRIMVEPVPPEEFGINSDARSPYAKDATACWHRTRKTFNQLVEAGYSREDIRRIPTDDYSIDQERISRRHLSDETDYNDATTEDSLRTYWVTEMYLNIDRDGDGLAELLKVTIAGGASSTSMGHLLDIEEVDSIPFSTSPSNILTHKFYGLSIADLVMDLQEINTTLLRQVIDNTYLANNGQTAANTDYVSIDDLMVRRPGGIVRFEGQQPWNSVVGPIPHN